MNLLRLNKQQSCLGDHILQVHIKETVPSMLPLIMSQIKFNLFFIISCKVAFYFGHIVLLVYRFFM